MNHLESFPSFSRRQILAAGSSSALAVSLNQPGVASDIVRGKAEHVISIWLGGGMGAGALGANGLLVGGLAVAVGVGVVAGVSSGSDSPASP